MLVLVVSIYLLFVFLKYGFFRGLIEFFRCFVKFFYVEWFRILVFF